MGVQYISSTSASIGPETTPVSEDLSSAGSAYYGEAYPTVQAGMFPGLHIQRGIVVVAPGIGAARVLNPFYVNVRLVEEGFIATSAISDVYELGETIGKAVTHYLYSLVDELIWFQQQKECLSLPMHRNFVKLEFYIGLV